MLFWILLDNFYYLNMSSAACKRALVITMITDTVKVFRHVYLYKIWYIDNVDTGCIKILKRAFHVKMRNKTKEI